MIPWARENLKKNVNINQHCSSIARWQADCWLRLSMWLMKFSVTLCLKWKDSRERPWEKGTFSTHKKCLFSHLHPCLSAERARPKEPVQWWGKGARSHSTQPWGQFHPIPEKQRPPLQIQAQLRKVFSQAAAELPFPSAPHWRKKQARSLRNPPPSIPGTVIFIYFITNVKGRSELRTAQGAEKLRSLLQI